MLVHRLNLFGEEINRMNNWASWHVLLLVSICVVQSFSLYVSSLLFQDEKRCWPRGPPLIEWNPSKAATAWGTYLQGHADLNIKFWLVFSEMPRAHILVLRNKNWCAPSDASDATRARWGCGQKVCPPPSINYCNTMSGSGRVPVLFFVFKVLILQVSIFHLTLSLSIEKATQASSGLSAFLPSINACAAL